HHARGHQHHRHPRAGQGRPAPGELQSRPDAPARPVRSEPGGGAGPGRAERVDAGARGISRWAAMMTTLRSWLAAALAALLLGPAPSVALDLGRLLDVGKD